MREPRLHPLLQQLQNILDGGKTTNQTSFIKVLKLNNVKKPAAALGGPEAHQSAGDADHSDGSLGGLGDVEQVVEQRLVLVVGEQVELIQDEQHGPAAAAIACTHTQKPNIQHFLSFILKIKSTNEIIPLNVPTFLQRLQQERQILRKTSLNN